MSLPQSQSLSLSLSPLTLVPSCPYTSHSGLPVWCLIPLIPRSSTSVSAEQCRPISATPPSLCSSAYPASSAAIAAKLTVPSSKRRGSSLRCTTNRSLPTEASTVPPPKYI